MPITIYEVACDSLGFEETLWTDLYTSVKSAKKSVEETYPNTIKWEKHIGDSFSSQVINNKRYRIYPKELKD